MPVGRLEVSDGRDTGGPTRVASSRHPVYDTLGAAYTTTRREDPRIAARIRAALGDADSVVNIGAGAGAYEPPDVPVVAVEPSPTMIAQRPTQGAPVRQGVAESLPLADGEVDAALAVLTTHHWSDLSRALREIRRVARRRAVIFTCDPEFTGFWLYRDYFPSFLTSFRTGLPALREYEPLGPLRIEPVPIPQDCADGFAAAYWARPEAYLDPGCRANISGFHTIPAAELRAGIDRLRNDLESGAWERRYAPGRRAELDCGYRLVVADLRADGVPR
jgi:SAM-dependent methyltransferase